MKLRQALLACLPIAALGVFSFLVVCCGGGKSGGQASTDKVASHIGSQTTNGGGGTGDGGGGQGVYCSANNPNPQLQNKLVMREIYEAQPGEMGTTELMEVPDSGSRDARFSIANVKTLLDALRIYFGPAANSLPILRQEYWINDFFPLIVFTQDDLELTTDAHDPIVMSETCEKKQIAVWRDDVGTGTKGTLYINIPLFQKLDDLNRTALLAHEFLYKQARLAGAQSSDQVRSFVRELLSKKGPKPLFTDWQDSTDSRLAGLLPNQRAGFKSCVGVVDEDPGKNKSTLYFYEYADKNKLQHFVFPYLDSDLISFDIMAPNNFVIAAAASKSQNFINEATDLMAIAHQMLSADMKISGMDGNGHAIGTEGVNDLTARYLGTGFLSQEFKSPPSPGQGLPDAVVQALADLSQDPDEFVWEKLTTNGDNKENMTFRLLNPAKGDVQTDAKGNRSFSISPGTIEVQSKKGDKLRFKMNCSNYFDTFEQLPTTLYHPQQQFFPNLPKDNPKLNVTINEGSWRSYSNEQNSKNYQNRDFVGMIIEQLKNDSSSILTGTTTELRSNDLLSLNSDLAHSGQVYVSSCQAFSNEANLNNFYHTGESPLIAKNPLMQIRTCLILDFDQEQESYLLYFDSSLAENSGAVISDTHAGSLLTDQIVIPDPPILPRTSPPVLFHTQLSVVRHVPYLNIKKSKRPVILNPVVNAPTPPVSF